MTSLVTASAYCYKSERMLRMIGFVNLRVSLGFMNGAVSMLRWRVNRIDFDRLVGGSIGQIMPNPRWHDNGVTGFGNLLLSIKKDGHFT